MRAYTKKRLTKNLPVATGRFFADIIFPRTCYGCNKAGKYLCANCYQNPGTLPHSICPHCDVRLPEGILSPICKRKINLNRIFVCALYRENNIVNELIKDLKYKSAHNLAISLSNFAWWWLKKERYSDLIQNNLDFIIPVPSHIKKEKRRGFNHAGKLAEQLSKLSGVSFAQQGLIKIKNTESQVDTDSKERRIKNVSDSFGINTRFAADLKNKNILLVDDVVTTGSTISECAKTLRRGGAKEVWALVIAKD